MIDPIYIHKRFLEFLGKTNEHWLPWKEYPFYCPVCKKEQYFLHDSTELIGFVGKPRKSMEIYVCPIHKNFKRTAIFNHETDEILV